MDINTFLLIWVCIIGLCMGSFFNVVILRSLSGESIVYPASKCPKCGHKLFWWHNIPVLSYIMLKGKCHFCKEKISIQYPIIEILTMVLFGMAFRWYGLSYTALFVIFWLSCLLIMTVTDIKEKLVDCKLAIAAGISGLIFAGITAGKYGILCSALGMIAGVLVMELIARSGFIFAKKRAMGEADTYVAGALGAIFGIFTIVRVLLLSLCVSMIFILPVFFYNKYREGNKQTVITAVLFTVSSLVYYRLWQNWWTLAAIAVTGVFLAYFILKGINKSKEGNYLPYVPALAIAAAYYIFI